MPTQYIEDTSGESAIARLYQLQYEVLAKHRELNDTVESRKREEGAPKTEGTNRTAEEFDTVRLEKLNIEKAEKRQLPKVKASVRDLSETIAAQLNELAAAAPERDAKRRCTQDARRAAWEFLEETNSLRTANELTGITITKPQPESTLRPDEINDLAAMRNVMNDQARDEWTLSQVWQQLLNKHHVNLDIASELDRASEQRDDATAQLEKHNERIKQLEKQNEDLGGRVDKLQRNMSALEIEHGKELNALRASTTQDAREADEAHQTALRAETDKIQALDQQLAASRATGQAATASKTELEESLGKLRQEHSTAKETLEGQVTNLKNKISQLESTITEGSTQLGFQTNATQAAEQQQSRILEAFLPTMGANTAEHEVSQIIEGVCRFELASDLPRLALPLPDKALGWDISTQCGSSVPPLDRANANIALRRLWLLSCCAPTDSTTALDLIEVVMGVHRHIHNQQQTSERDMAFVLKAVESFHNHFFDVFHENNIILASEPRILVIARCAELAIRLQARVLVKTLLEICVNLSWAAGEISTVEKSPLLFGLLEWLRQALNQPAQTESLLDIILAQPNLDLAPIQSSARNAHDAASRSLIGTTTAIIIVDYNTNSVRSYAHAEIGYRLGEDFSEHVAVLAPRRVDGNFDSPTDPFLLRQNSLESADWVAKYLTEGIRAAFDKAKGTFSAS